MELKVGQQFEVVEVLTDGGHTCAFKLGGWYVSRKPDIYGLLNVFPAEYESATDQDILAIIVGTEIKPVGRLTVNKVK